ncbi:MAG: hypothetical protein ACREQZ_01125 [Woeseiaceae bacterium]
METLDRERKGHGVLRGLALIGCGWCTVVLGAPSPDPACDRSARGLQSLNVASQALEFQAVDHLEAPLPDPDSPVGADGPLSVTEPGAPVLYLAPRVEALLRTVFETEDDSVSSTAPRHGPSGVTAAGNAAPDLDARPVPATVIDRSLEVGRFQRLMYRKDI